MSTKKKQNRRQFLKTYAATSLGVFAAPLVVPDSALGLSGTTAPSNRIVMGAIGTGGQGTHNLRVFLNFPDVQMVAVCDVDTKHKDRARNIVQKKYGNKDCSAMHDFRELVAKKGIDAVSICTPDHWHALTSIAAANAGKDIYCEKPLANSVGEGRAICNAIEKNKQILQTGSHERSNPKCRYACELVRNGRIGKLKTIRINLPFTDRHHKQMLAMKKNPPNMPVPEGFDYDFWLGHTPKVPYTEKRCHFWWRFILSYGVGEMTDRGAHVIDIGQLGAGMDDTGPVEFEATGSRNAHLMYNTFTDYSFINRYANGMQMIGANKGPRGLKFEGTDGWIFVHIHGGKLEASHPSLLKEKIADNETHLGRSPGHQRNFIDCVKSRKAPFAKSEIGQRTATICHLNNIAMLTGRTLKWDPVKEEIIGDAQASKLLTPTMRMPWRL